MDRRLRSTLLAEGTSDRALLPILKLTLAAHVSPAVLLDDPQRADEARLAMRVKRNEGARIRSAIDEYPCELLFVHRDADKADETATDAGRPKRLGEISGWAAAAALPADGGVSIVPVVPVRMTESWLLVGEVAIRAAARNPHGTIRLGLPSPRELEGRRDVKRLLAEALKAASGLGAGRLKKFDVNQARGRIAVTDLPRLRLLPAFAAFEREVAATCASRGWSG